MAAADVGQDFTFTDEIITFQPEDSFLLASVAVSMDGILEYTEVFGCLLTVPSAETGVTLGRSSSTVSIIDSDCKSHVVSWTGSYYHFP